MNSAASTPMPLHSTSLNPALATLQAYPFERLKKLFDGITPNTDYAPISLGIGEPKHATPPLIVEAMTQNLSKLAHYPATAGEPALRQACARWLQTRYGVTADAATQVLPVGGSREALFAFAQVVVARTSESSQVVVNRHTTPEPLVICPNPFYQIYEGAALLAGAQPHYLPSRPERNFGIDLAAVPADVWARAQLIYVCSPGNPTGAVMSLDDWHTLFALSDQYGFVIASDECYSEIYFGDTPPLGGLQAATQLGRTDFKNLVMFTSLSKRSNVPGLRSGFVAGDAAILKAFLLYRTYHGSALPSVTQAASIAAWADESHVQDNRALYRAKFAKVTALLQSVLDVRLPDAAFYLWAGIPSHICKGNDEAFAQALYAHYNVTVLPGSYLARDVNGHNPGAGRIRMALVAGTDECEEAANRIVQFCGQFPR